MRKSTKKIQEICKFLSNTDLHTDAKSSKTSQSHRKTPQNGRFCTVPTYCGGHMRKSTKKIQEICEFFSHTDWVYTYCFCLKPINFV
jgi:hypothetical protein